MSTKMTYRIWKRRRRKKEGTEFKVNLFRKVESEI
jgi:hypothetical protein